jgi:hypothetical protein
VYTQAVIERPDFSGFFAVDVVDAFLAGVDWADVNPDEDGQPDAAFALLQDRHYVEGVVTSITLTINPDDFHKILAWSRSGGITLAQGVLLPVRTV